MTDATKTRITVGKNGSFKVEGEFEIADANGNLFDLAGRTKISLCRCGQSAKMPFCDGAHGRCGFASEVVASVLPPPKA